MNVYLAGAVRGTHGAWRSRVPEIPGVRFMHPGARIAAENEEARHDLYAPADRVAVRMCDVLLAHCDRIEGGHGTAVEIGMALALGKEVLLVCPTPEARWVWRFAAAAVPHVYESLEAAVATIRYMAAQVSGTARCAVDDLRERR